MARVRKPPGLIRRIGATVMLVWVLGFLWFALALPRPAGAQKTDGVIALTGAGGRIPRAIDVLRVRRLVACEGGRARAGRARGEGQGVACRAPATRARAEPSDPADGREGEHAHAARAR